MKLKIILTVLVLVVTFMAPRVGTWVADKIHYHFSAIDPDSVFMWGVVHHIVQALIPVFIILIWKKEYFKDWGFKVGNKKAGLQWVGWFTLIWGSIYLFITLYHIFNQTIPQAYYDVTDPRNLLGELFFRLIIVGPSEEILFRSFPIVLLLAAGYVKNTTIFGFQISTAGIISAPIFALAHIGFNIYPFEVYQFNGVQLITSLGFGLLYAIVFQHTRSIYYPMIIHAISDVVPVISLYLIHMLA